MHNVEATKTSLTSAKIFGNWTPWTEPLWGGSSFLLFGARARRPSGALGQGQRRPHGGGGWDADGGQAQSEIHLVAWRGWWAATWARNRALQIWMGEVGNTDQQIWDVGFSQLYPKNLVHSNCLIVSAVFSHSQSWMTSVGAANI